MNDPATDLSTVLSVPIHHQTIEHRQDLRVTNTNEAPLEVCLRLTALRAAMDAVALVDKDRYFAKPDAVRSTPGLFLDEAFSQAERIIGYYETGQWEPQPPPVVTVNLPAVEEEK